MHDSKPERTFQVPVWFNVAANSRDEAWQTIQTYVDTLLTHVPAHIFPKNLMPVYEYTVEEPVENEEQIPTGMYYKDGVVPGT